MYSGYYWSPNTTTWGDGRDSNFAFWKKALWSTVELKQQFGGTWRADRGNNAGEGRPKPCVWWTSDTRHHQDAWPLVHKTSGRAPQVIFISLGRQKPNFQNLNHTQDILIHIEYMYKHTYIHIYAYEGLSSKSWRRKIKQKGFLFGHPWSIRTTTKTLWAKEIE